MAVIPSLFSARNNLQLAIVYGCGTALLCTNLYVGAQLGNVHNQLAILQSDLNNSKTEIEKLKATSLMTNKVAGRTLNAIREELQAARDQAASAVGEVKIGAIRRAEDLSVELARKLVSEQARNERLQAQLKREISKVEEATQTANARIRDVKTDVVAVRSEIADNQNRLERTVADLRRVKGDLGIQSGQIATNQKELTALKALGDKSYFEFDLKGKQPLNIAGVNLALKKADTKKFRFTLDVFVNDKKVEKKDRIVNEPVQFMVTKVRQPYSLEVNELYEIVVNEVGKNSVKGYLATPRGPSL
jgi:DNA repair exonuclease SbcCD ATPase subunit